LSVSIKTKILASFGGDNLDPDILDMKAGDSFKLLVHRDDEQASYSGVTNMEGMLMVADRAEQFLTQLGYDPSFAAAYAKAYSHKGFQTSFRLKALGEQWNVEEGVTLDIQGINFIEIRADKLMSKDEITARSNSQNKAARVVQPGEEDTVEPTQAGQAQQEQSSTPGDFSSQGGYGAYNPNPSKNDPFAGM
jgi:hypothetical protein